MADAGAPRLLPPGKSPRTERSFAVAFAVAMVAFVAWIAWAAWPSWPFLAVAAVALPTGAALCAWSPFTPRQRLRARLVLGLMAAPAIVLLVGLRLAGGHGMANLLWSGWLVAFGAGAAIGYALRAHRAVRPRAPA